MSTNNTNEQVLSYDAAIERAKDAVEQAWLAHEGTEMNSASERSRFEFFVRDLAEELQAEVKAEIKHNQPKLKLNHAA